MKKGVLLIAALVSVFALSSCSVYYVYPDSSYTPPAAEYSSGSGVSAAYGYTYVYERPYTPPAPVVVEQDYYVYKPEVNITNYIVIKVTGNTYRFYRGGSEIAVWVIYNNGRVVKKGQIINGLVRAFNSANRLVFEAVFNNDDYHGPYREYHPNGKLKIEAIYSKGLLDGYYRSYASEGSLKEEGLFKRGNRHGYFKVFGPDGKEKEKAYYDNGKKRQFNEKEKREFENEWEQAYRGYSENMKAFEEDTRKEYVKHGSGSFGQKQAEKTEPAGGWGSYYSKRYGEAKEEAKDEAREIREEAKEMKQEAKQFGYEAKKDAKEDAREVREEAKETRQDAKEIKYQPKKEVKQDVRQIKENAREKVNAAKERVVEKGQGRMKKEADFKQSENGEGKGDKGKEKEDEDKGKKEDKKDKPAVKNKFGR